jgi:deoxycytidylate deaminase/dephospho-CoA kinase
MENNGLIIGLTGRFGAGCTTTSNFFVKNRILNCKNYSISTFLKDKAKKEIADFDKKTSEERRKILQDLGDNLRKEKLSALVDHIIKDIKENNVTNAVIECIRNPGEVKELRSVFSNRFFLLAIDSETETRWKRVEKLYNGNRVSFDINDLRDAGEDQPYYGQNVKKCIELADILINSEENFYKENETKDEIVIDSYGQKLSDYTNLMLKPGVRPPYPDELYMHHACSVALWSKCSKRQVGAIIVHELSNKKSKTQDINEKDNGDKEIVFESYVIATGCNNVPWGEIECRILYKDEPNGIRCHRDKVKKDHFSEYKYCRLCSKMLSDPNLICECGCENKKLPGKLLDVCRAVHAEESAILQAAKLGTTPLNGAKLYTSTFPCMLCCKKIINAGIKNVIYLESYPMEESLAINMFRKCNVKVSKYEGGNSIAFNRLFKRE